MKLASTLLIIGAALMGAIASTSAGGAEIAPAEAQQLGVDAYIYGYPLVTMEYTRRVMTNVVRPEGTRAPMGHLIRMRAYPTAAFRDVTAPNADTLYTTAWIDVGKEPWVLSLPDANDRYYLFPMLDGWTNVFQVPGKRTTGTGPQKYAITGPGWKGTLPAGVTEYKSPTSIVWLLGRIYCTGTPEDYAAVHKMQDAICLAPLSNYDKPYNPSAGTVDPGIDMKTPVRDQVNRLSAPDYFNLLATLMKDNPPAAADAPMLAKMARIGIVPGKPFDLGRFEPAVRQALMAVPQYGVEKIMGWAKAGIAAGANKDVNGWLFSTKTGIYGTEYLQRAFITAIGLGANRPEDAIYPTSEVSAAGQPYDGSKKYVIHFDKGNLPPVNGFWSLTMYDEQFFFVDNPLNRYTLSARNSLKTNPDGSTDLYLQSESPGADKESNWLPAPKGRFVPMFRFYWPKESIIDGTWKMPAVNEVK
ncbi:MAG: hypothetical protein DCC65_00615 [Planctomycetota bacterium]|nr:MAG: hypothetical protein DCC65_00615 [Planctomycetota bacterium]